MDGTTARLTQLRRELSQFTDYHDLVDYYLDHVSMQNFVATPYRTLTVLLFDKNNTILDEDKYSGSFVIDFRVQWTMSYSLDPDGYGAFDHFDNLHYLQLHLYLYFKSTRAHTPSTLGKFDFGYPCERDNFLKKMKEFCVEIDTNLSQENYLGHTLAYTDAI